MYRYVKLSLLLFILCLLVVMPTVAQDDMAQANKDRILNALTEFNAGHPEAFYNLFAEPYMSNQGETTLQQTTRADNEYFGNALLTAIPELQVVPDALIAQGDWVAVEVVFNGTFSQPFMFEPISSDPFPPTNAAVTWTEMDFLHFNDAGLIDEEWALSDTTTLFAQLGIMPSMDDGSGGDMPSPAVDYTPLTGDALAASFTSGMEARNTGVIQTMLDLDAMASTAPYYTNPYLSHQMGVVTEVDPTQEGPDPVLVAVNTAMPDIAHETTVEIAEGDWVAYLITLNGTFTGEVNMGPDMTLTPNGQTISWQVAFIERFNADGLITEEWFEVDPMPLFMGLGIMPPMDAS